MHLAMCIACNDTPFGPSLIRITILGTFRRVPCKDRGAKRAAVSTVEERHTMMGKAIYSFVGFFCISVSMKDLSSDWANPVLLVVG